MQRGLRLFPGGERAVVEPYAAEIDITAAATRQRKDCGAFAEASTPVRDCRIAAVTSRVDDWWQRDAGNREGYDVLLSVHRYGDPGWKVSGTINAPDPVPAMFIDDGGGPQQRLSTSAHELGHSLGLPHADGGISKDLTSGTCGGALSGQLGEPWPPDGAGRLQGVAWNGAARADTPESPLFDVMSYCANDGPGSTPDPLLSARNWNHSMVELQQFNAARERTTVSAAAAGGAFTSGVVGPDGSAEIDRVFPAAAGNLVPASEPGSTLRIRALDANGGELKEVGAHVKLLSDVDSVAIFTAPVPAGADSVELLSGGAVVDRVSRSEPPEVRLLSPRRGMRVGRSLDVRWKASDPDGDPLLSTVEYSPNGRSGWRTVFTSEDARRATIPGRSLEASRKARVRVTVNDAFGQARVRSAPFRVAGAPPTARIERPAGGERLQAGVPVQLVGSAFDDRRKQLRGRSLSWFAGARRLGRGQQLRVSLPAGRVKLRLVARDRRGRAGRAARALRVAPVPLRLVGLSAPDRVGPRARSVKLTVATTTRATLRARGTKHRVGPRSRRVKVPLPAKPARGVIKIAVTIKASGPKQSPLTATLYVLRA
jgi:hypothetical protein